MLALADPEEGGRVQGLEPPFSETEKLRISVSKIRLKTEGNGNRHLAYESK